MLVHAVAGILDRDLHVVARLDAVLQRRSAAEALEGGLELEPAAVRHRIAGVEREVEQRVFELVRIDERRIRLAAGRRRDLDVRRQRATEQPDDAGDEILDIDRPRLQCLASGEAQQPLGQIGAAVRSRDRRLDELGDEGRIGEPLAQRHEVAEHHRQQIVEIMGDAAGELADRLHLGGLHDRRLGGLLAGDVERQDEKSGDVVVAVHLGHQPGANDGGAVGAEHRLVLEGHRLAGAHAVDIGAQFVEGLAPDHGERIAADDLILLAAEGSGEPFVGEQAAQVLVPIRDAGRQAVGDEMQPRLAAAQLLGDLLLLGDRAHQPVVRRLELGGACLDPAFEVLVLLTDQAFEAALLGDIGVDGDETAVWQRLAADGKNAAVGARPLDGMRVPNADLGEPGRDECLDVTGTVLAGFGIPAHQGLVRRAAVDQHRRVAQQSDEAPVPADQAQGTVEHGDPLVDVIEPRLQRGRGYGCERFGERHRPYLPSPAAPAGTRTVPMRKTIGSAAHAFKINRNALAASYNSIHSPNSLVMAAG